MPAHVTTALERFPSTRFMGSKRKLVPLILSGVARTGAHTILDAFSGSGVVSYALKVAGYGVTANDYLAYAFRTAHAVIANRTETLQPRDLDLLARQEPTGGDFIASTFGGLYFTRDDLEFLDRLSANIQGLASPYKASLALASAARACLRRQPRGVFTFTGDRYNDGRRHLRTSLADLFVESAQAFNRAVFETPETHHAIQGDVFDAPESSDAVYLDPPYLSAMSDNEYSRRYHFVEGLMSYWHGVTIDHSTKTKKIIRPYSRFNERRTIHRTFEDLFYKFKQSSIVLSYSSSGIPNEEELIEMLSHYKRKVEVLSQDHTYTFGTHSHKPQNGNNRVQELLFVAT